MNVLFVGNSYTYFNNMPSIFAALAEQNGKCVCVDAVTKGGRKLYENLNPEDSYHAQLLELCAQKQYDVLILQEQSYFALVDYEKFLEGILGLVKLVQAKRVILYATWGRKAGCPLLDELGYTTDSMTQALLEAYERAAAACGTELSPVGSAFREMATIDPSAELYSADLSHPSHLGSALAALVHYGRVFGELPDDVDSISDDATLNASLRKAAKTVLFSV